MKQLLSATFAAVMVAAALYSHALAQTTTVASTTPPADVPINRPLVGVEQLKAAGFTDATLVAPYRDRFLSPVYYFKVKETVESEDVRKAWGDNANIVTVTIVPKTDKQWVYYNGEIEIHDVNGRIQARATGASYYIVVTGPDLKKVVNLAHNLEVLY